MDDQTGERRDRFAWIVTRVGTRRAALRVLAGGALGGAVAFGTAVPRLDAASEFRWLCCRKCRGLFSGRPGPCPAGGVHASDGVKWYAPASGGPPAPGEETNWRECTSCGLLTYLGGGPCLATGNGHTPTQTVYHLEYNQPPEPNEERGWRYCPKCQGLFNGRRRKRGVCPAGGAHKPYPGYNYNLDVVP